MAYTLNHQAKHLLLLPLSLLIFFSSPCHSQSCNSLTISTTHTFTSCNQLPELSSSLHWTYNSSNSTLTFAFTAPPATSTGWIAWGINPTSTGMIGTQAILSFPHSNGSLIVHTFDISSYYPVVPSPIMFDIWGLSAEFIGHAGTLRMFGNVKLPPEMVELNQVWQVGSSVMNDSIPNKHAFGLQNLRAKGTLNLITGRTSGFGDSRIRMRNIHGVMNTVSWGILVPFGGVIARFFKAFRPADGTWFYVHVSTQLIGYSVGVAGWGTGLKLGSMSKGVKHTTHRNIGIALFSLATLQVLALFLRPKQDHKYRSYWNLYHHGVGYAVILMGIINVFEGLSILKPRKAWNYTYITFITVLAILAFSLEISTWIGARRKPKANTTTEKHYDSTSAGNGQHEEQQSLPA
ncbi:hypothetical protein J5N97_019856 [Dioscorea zingiberensis]|uniref:Cytochrome b561 and DOMON domain-containing protein n=1 Tax=Dioscorea zingiberensis TaxID=325984 RepID=A0A9D5HD42_9LILI|nr:hypothetical protein J5N97_019856 [Dioscorea zingiberensis]